MEVLLRSGCVEILTAVNVVGIRRAMTLARRLCPTNAVVQSANSPIGDWTMRPLFAQKLANSPAGASR